MGSLSQHSGSQHGGMQGYGGVPQLGSLPYLPFGGGPGSVHGSEHGDFMGPMNPALTGSTSMYGMGMPGMGMGMGMGMGGMNMGAPRNTVMTNMNMFSGSTPGTNASQSNFAGAGGMGGMIPPSALGMQQRPMSTFSLATSVNPFAGPSMNPNPSDDELFTALRNYLSTQDLMTVTKK